MHKAIRYIGSKQKVLPFLEEHLFSHLKEGSTFFDGFVGSGIVSQYVTVNHPNVKISGGDISAYSEILFNILNISAFENKKILELIQEFDLKDMVEGDIFNEFSNLGIPTTFTESRNFFHEKSGKVIDSFKSFLNEKLNAGLITEEQSKILLFFLVSYSCKVANTTSVFGAFLKSPAKYKNFDVVFVEKILTDLSDIIEVNNSSKFYLGDIIKNLKEIPNQTIIYLDPPYSTRRYESNYHILNYIVDLQFTSSQIKEKSKTGQPKEISNNMFGKKKEAELIFAEMIDIGVTKSELLGISYNTDGLIKQTWLENYCKEKNYKLETKKIIYKRFKSKIEITNRSELEEILWLIKK
jgi:adenine-specific DNA-methyltransferase